MWGAAKLKLLREPLFALVEREVLSCHRCLSDFSPQQLAAIAWSYAMVNFEAPKLFEAVQEEAKRVPQLAKVLEQAGLLQRGPDGSVPRARAAQHGPYGQQQPGGVNGPLGGGSQHSGGRQGPPLQHQMQPRKPGIPPGTGPSGATPGGGAAAHVAAGANGALGRGSGAGMPGGGPGVGAGGGPNGPIKGAVDEAVERHMKEMEEKQRQVLGESDPDGGASCPLCVEEMDTTDLSFLPCPCGYQVCLLCFNTIQKEGNKQCPACRTEYDESKFQKQAPPSAAKSKVAADANDGWESTGAKKKSAKKPAPALSFPGFQPRVEAMLLQCHEMGTVSRGELDERVMEDLKSMPERGAVAVLSEFMKKDMTRIRNKSAFLNGIIGRVQEELAQDRLLQAGEGKVGLGAFIPAPLQGGPPPAPSPSDHLRGPVVGGPPPGGAARPGQGPGWQGPMGTGGGGMGPGGWSAGDDVAMLSYGMANLGGEKRGGGGGGGLGGAPTVEEQEQARRQVEQWILARQHGGHPGHGLPQGDGWSLGGGGVGGGYGSRGLGDGGALGYGDGGAVGSGLVHGTSESEVKGDAGAGSRLLAMLQGGGGGGGGGAESGGGGGERGEKLPLFMRANGGLGGPGGRGTIGSGRGVVGGPQAGPMHNGFGGDVVLRERCYECGRTSEGEVDHTDGNFYCVACWEQFEVWRSGQAQGGCNRNKGKLLPT